MNFVPYQYLIVLTMKMKEQKIFDYRGYEWVFEDWCDENDKCHKDNYGICVTSNDAKKSWNIAGKHVSDYCDKNGNLDSNKCKELIDKNFNHR